MKKLLAWFRDMSIKGKLTFAFIFVVFTPILLVGLLLTQSLRSMAIDHATQQTLNNVEKIKKRTEDILKIPADVSGKLFFDRNLKALLSGNYSTRAEVMHAYNSYSDFTDYRQLYKELSGIRVYSPNSTLLNNWTFLPVDSRTEGTTWYGDALRNRGKIAWHYIEDSTRGNVRYLSLVRTLFLDDLTVSGVLVITVNPEVMQAVVSQEPFETMLVTGEQDIVAARDTSLIGRTLDSLPLYPLHTDRADSIWDAEYGGRAAKVVVRPIQTENAPGVIRAVSIIPVDSFLQQAREVSSIAMTIILGSMVLSMLLILFFSSALTRRIGLLSRSIRFVAAGDFTRAVQLEGRDEIGQLSGHLHSMVRSIDTLMKEVAEANLQKSELLLKQKEIKLQVLTNQVNPHFMFNVLETIRMKAHQHEEEEIADVVASLGKLLRHNLEIGNEPVPLAGELRTVCHYLEIQTFRFGDRIEYTLPDAEEAAGCLVLPMVLQPVVENAIIHGLERKVGRGRVTVLLVHDDGGSRLIVHDDGVGMEEHALAQITGSLQGQPEPGGRIGLRNVHERLQLFYGPEYGLSIESAAGEGTTVTITLPGGEAHVQAAHY